MRKFTKAFTLIEMLIVIVIISILAAALLPKMGSAQAIARDAARKADLQNIAQAVVAYQIGNGEFPVDCGPVSNIASDLSSAGMDSIPIDPKKSLTWTGGIECNGNVQSFSGGQYGYTVIKKYGISNNGFILMAKTETLGGSNRVLTGNNYSQDSEYQDISSALCTTVTEGSLAKCSVDKGNYNPLRYIYLY